jgi:hypothetical protein
MRIRKRGNGRSSGKEAPDTEQTDSPIDPIAVFSQQLIMDADWFDETERC